MSKILSVTPYRYTPPENGGHQGIILVDRLLSIHNDILSLSTLDNKNSDTSVNTSFRLPTSKMRYLPYRLTNIISQSIQDFSATHLFLHHHYLFPSAYAAAQRNNIPLFIRSHNIESMRFKSLGKKWWRIMWWFEKYAYQRADKIFFVTEDDKLWAEKNYHIDPIKCIVLPFGINCPDMPPAAPPEMKASIAAQWNLRAEVPWIFFMGKLDYAPNAQAVEDILHKIYPLLKEEKIDFELIIFGKHLSESSQTTIHNLNVQHGDVHYLGFVPEIEPLLQSCELMLNPVNFGGGVKTKAIEALAWNNTVVSSYSGAMGIDKNYCGPQLIQVDDEDWPAYVQATIQRLQHPQYYRTPAAFYDYYALDKIADRTQIHFQ